MRDIDEPHGDPVRRLEALVGASEKDAEEGAMTPKFRSASSCTIMMKAVFDGSSGMIPVNAGRCRPEGYFLSSLAVFLIAPLAFSGVLVEDSFDWGAGVAGREWITAGMTVDGQQTQTGGPVWTVNTATNAVFSGNGGAGSGRLSLSGGNSTETIHFTPVGGWANGAVTATLSGTYFPNTSGTRGLYFGFQIANPDSALITNQKTDKLFAQLGNGGVVSLKSIVGGQTNNAANATLSYTPGDIVTLALTVNVANKTASLITTGLSNAKTQTVTWTSSAIPAWTSFTVNHSAGTAILDYVECRSDLGGIRDTFDWGAGVEGRVNITAGRSIAGLKAAGLTAWKTAAGQAVFSGTSGVGGGMLTLSGSGTAVRVSCPFSGVAIAQTSGRYDAASSGATSGVYVGFESALPQAVFMDGQTQDHLFVRVNSSGEVELAAVVDGVAFSSFSSPAIPAFVSGDALQISLMVDMTRRSASAAVKNLSRGGVAVTNQLAWSGAADWSFLTLNNTGNGAIALDDVSVSSLNDIGQWTPFWRGMPLAGEWLAGGQGLDVITDYQRKNSFATQTRLLPMEVPYADNLNVVRLIGGWNVNFGAEKPIPADVADLVYKDAYGNLQYRWDKLALRLNPYVSLGYTNLTLVLDNIPYCFPSNIIMQSYGQVATPAHFVEWQTFVSNLCVALVNLYGFDTANQFRFRQGTEAGSATRFAGTQEDYFKIYDHSATAIKSVLPGAKFGPFNMAEANNVDMLQLARHCASGTNAATGTIGSPFDFFSISDYIAQANHPHNPQSNADADISYFRQVQAELPWPVSWEVHEFGILNCESNLATDEPGARGAAWDFQTMSRYREGGLSRWYHWGVFDSFRSASGLHKLLTSHGWFLAVLDRTAGGKAVVLEPEPPADAGTQVRAVAICGGDRNWILAGVFNPDRTNHTPETVTLRIPQELLSVNDGDKILWTSLNDTNAVHYLIRRDLEKNGMLNAAFSAVPEQLASVRNMTTNSTLSPEQEFLATLLPKYEQAITDSLTLKPFPGTVATNQGELVLTATLTPPETAVICIGPDQTATGVPYAWLDAQGFATNGYASAAQADCDGDGMTNGDECLAGTDPLNAASRFDLRWQDGQLAWEAVSNRTYRILSSTNLLNGWSLFDTCSVSSNKTMTYPLDDKDPMRFFRLQTGP